MPRSSDLRIFACGPIKLELRRRSQLGLCQRRKLVCHQDVWVHILTEYRMNVCRVTCIIHVQSSFVFIIFPFFFFTFHSSATRISCIMPSVSTYSTILYCDAPHGFHPSVCVYIFTNHNASLELMLRCSCRKALWYFYTVVLACSFQQLLAWMSCHLLFVT